MKRFITLTLVVLALLAVQAAVATNVGARHLAQPPKKSHHHATRHEPQVEARSLVVSTMDMAALSADVQLELHEAFFRKLTSTLLPVIIETVRKLVIPGESQKHFRFWDVHISEFNIESFAISFAAPDEVRVSLTGLSLQIPSTEFEVMDKILFVKLTCHGHFSAEMSGTNAVLSFPLKRGADGHFAIGQVSSQVTFGSLAIHEKMDHWLCRIGQDIIQIFIGSITDLIKKLIEKDAPAKIGELVQKVLDKALTKLNVNLVSNPVATANSISVTIDLLPASSQGARASLAIQPAAPRRRSSSAFPARDIEVFTGQNALNNILEYEREKGHLSYTKTLKGVNTSVFKTLIPAAYAACPDCPLGITVFFPAAAPTTTVNADTIGLDVLDAVLGLLAVPNATTQLPLLELYLNATGAATNVSVRASGVTESLYFNLALDTFSLSLRRSDIGPFDPSIIGDIIAFILKDVVVPDFNKHFAGVPIPSFGLFNVTALEVALNNGKVDVGLDIDLK